VPLWIAYIRPALAKAVRIESPRNWLGIEDFWL
jgi:hypothetical protein